MNTQEDAAVLSRDKLISFLNDSTEPFQCIASSSGSRCLEMVPFNLLKASELWGILFEEPPEVRAATYSTYAKDILELILCAQHQAQEKSEKQVQLWTDQAGLTTATTTPEDAGPDRSVTLGGATRNTDAAQLAEVENSQPNQEDRRLSTALDIDDSLRTAIKTKQAKKTEETGIVYVALIVGPNDRIRWEKNLPRNINLKIGSTQREVSERRREIEKCGFETEIVYRSSRLSHYKLAEKLSLTELKNSCEPWDCQNCSNKVVKHREWFQVDEEVANKVVQRWVRFLEQNPYSTPTGDLKQEWRNLVDRIQTKRRDESIEPHDRRMKRWGVLDKGPRLFDKLKSNWQRFCAIRVLRYTWNNGWQIWSTFLIVSLVSQSERRVWTWALWLTSAAFFVRLASA